MNTYISGHPIICFPIKKPDSPLKKRVKIKEIPKLMLFSMSFTLSPANIPLFVELFNDF
jgi:hypothetical protein